LKGIRETDDGHGLREAFEQVLEKQREERGAVEAVQMPALATVERARQSVQEVGKDSKLGYCDQGRAQARRRTRTDGQWYRASEEARANHHRGCCRFVPQRHDPTCPRQTNNFNRQIQTRPKRSLPMW